MHTELNILLRSRFDSLPKRKRTAPGLFGSNQKTDPSYWLFAMSPMFLCELNVHRQVTVSGGEVTASEPEDCSSGPVDRCGSIGDQGSRRHAQTRGNATFSQGVAAKQGGPVYGSGGVFYMEGPTKFIENEVTETQGVSGSLSAVERTWLDATVTAATGGVEMFDGASGSTDEKFPGHLHVAPDGKLVISRPKTLT